MSTTYGNRPIRVRFSSNDSDGIAEFFDGSETGASGIQLPKFSTTERDAYTASTGEIIYNETTNKIQIYNGSAWGDVDTDTDTTLTLVDEDNMSSNSATSVPSQQSVKAYVDTEIAGHDSQHSDITLNTFAAATGAVDINDQELQKAVLKDYAETDVAISSGTTLAIDLSAGNTGSVTLAHNVTDIDFTNVPANGVSSFTLKVTQDGTGSRTMAINAITVNGGSNVTGKTVDAGGLTLTTTANKEDIVTFLFFDAGTPFINALLNFG